MSAIEGAFCLDGKNVEHSDFLRTYMQPAVVAFAARIESDLLALYPTFNSQKVD